MARKSYFLICIAILILGFHVRAQTYITVLGVAQDGGFPHIGCQNECQEAHQDQSLAKFVTSLALVDPASKKWWLFEATPDLDKQLQYFQELTNKEYNYLPEGIFLTHAHIGHYTGLMFLGREALGAKNVNVYALPEMIYFLQTNGPWSQLIDLKNIIPNNHYENTSVGLTVDISVKAFQVPHRDEFSKTAGFKIETAHKSYLFIPDIDKWNKWETSIVEKVKEVDYAFLDATFFEDGELPNRAMSEVPHPFVSETMSLFANEKKSIKSKVHFIHLNHTNPLLFKMEKVNEVMKKGYRVAEQGKVYR